MGESIAHFLTIKNSEMARRQGISLRLGLLRKRFKGHIFICVAKFAAQVMIITRKLRVQVLVSTLQAGTAGCQAGNDSLGQIGLLIHDPRRFADFATIFVF